MPAKAPDGGAPVRAAEGNPYCFTCTRCGAQMTILAFLTDTFAIHRILDHLGLSPPEEKPPPPLRETRRVPVDEEGRELVGP